MLVSVIKLDGVLLKVSHGKRRLRQQNGKINIKYKMNLVYQRKEERNDFDRIIISLRGGNPASGSKLTKLFSPVKIN